MRTFPFALLICLLAIPVHSQSKVLWEESYGGVFADSAHAVKQTPDGGFALAGTTRLNAKGEEFYLVKTDPSGAEEWSQAYGLPWDDGCHGMCLTSDGGYTLVGRSKVSCGVQDYRISIAKIAADGTLEWFDIASGSNPSFAFDVKQTSDGGYIVVGGMSGQVALVKYDSNGGEVWFRTFGSGLSEHGSSVLETSDGGYLVAGSRFDSTVWPHVGKAYVAKTDGSGFVVWSQVYGGPDIDFASCVQEVSTGGYVFAGSTESYGPGPWNSWLVRLDPSGTVMWDSVFGQSNEEWFSSSVTETGEGGFILAGTRQVPGNSDRQIEVLRTDALGSPVWSAQYGDVTRYHECYGVEQASDGGFVLCGEILESGPTSTRDAYLLRLDADLLIADQGSIPWTGATVNFDLYAGSANANRQYILVGGASGTSPGHLLPGGLAVLPINPDAFSLEVLLSLNTPTFTNFFGFLGPDGRQAAQLNVPPVLSMLGTVMSYAFCLSGPFDFVSNAQEVIIAF